MKKNGIKMDSQGKCEVIVYGERCKRTVYSVPDKWEFYIFINNEWVQVYHKSSNYSTEKENTDIQYEKMCDGCHKEKYCHEHCTHCDEYMDVEEHNKRMADAPYEWSVEMFIGGERTVCTMDAMGRIYDHVKAKEIARNVIEKTREGRSVDALFVVVKEKETGQVVKATEYGYDTVYCPRCGNPLGEYPALSRHCNKEICDSCGIEEALADAGHGHGRELSEWYEPQEESIAFKTAEQIRNEIKAKQRVTDDFSIVCGNKRVVDISVCDGGEYYLVYGCLPWLSGSIDRVSKDLANIEALIEDSESEKRDLDAYYDENHGTEHFDASWYSDWHKDVYGYRPRAGRH